MSWISATDPLALVAIQAGQVGTPSSEAAAAGANQLDSKQRSTEIGEPVPIVFARRRNDAGGVLISPGATECRFENDSSNNVTAWYHLVLSEGRISSIEVKDVFQGPCRVGSHSQTYNRRAGTWTPGNFLSDQNRTRRRFFTTEVINDSSESQRLQYLTLLATELTNPDQLSAYPFDLFNEWLEATLINPEDPVAFESWDYGENNIVRLAKDIKPTDFKTAEASYYCGSVGNYPDMSTLSFRVTIPNGFDQWNRQVHAFVRGGMWVTRLFDNVTGPSDNFADLVRWMLLNSGRLLSSLVDTAGLLTAATFLEQYRFRCNCNITKSSNYSDLVAKWAPYFLLAESNTSGKRGLRPLLPINSNGTINTGAITPVFTFTEDHIVPGTVEIQYTSLADRRPFVAQMIWRQQPDDDFGIIRTAEVRYAGTAANGPYESHDLSEFCCNEDHAVKAGAYILAKRRYTSHTIRFTARPQANSTVVIGGSIIRVRLARNATTGGIGYHDFLYQVERITKTLAGELSYEAVHFPIDSQGRSLIALDVANTVGSGIILSNGRSGLGCDLNSATDTTVPAETFTAPSLDTPTISIGGGIGVSPSDPPATNPNDGLDQSVTVGAATVQNPSNTSGFVPGSKIEVPQACGNSAPAEIIVVKNGVEIASYNGANAEGDKVVVSGGSAVFLTNGVITGVGATRGNEGDVYQVNVRCPDGSRTSVRATLGPDPFPTAKLVWTFAWNSVFQNQLSSSSVVSVGEPPYVVYEEGQWKIRGGAYNGGSTYLGSASWKINLVITSASYAQTVISNTVSGVYNVVSTNTF